MRATGPAEPPRSVALPRAEPARETGRVPEHDETPGHSPFGADLGFRFCGRYWDRTSDLFGVNEALYR